MFTVSCENDCIKVHCVKILHYSDSIGFFVNGISQIEVGRNLNVSLNFFFFIIFILVFKETVYAFERFFFCTSFIAVCSNGRRFGRDVNNLKFAH